jgi:hypothetical protein
MLTQALQVINQPPLATQELVQEQAINVKKLVQNKTYSQA